MKAASKLNTEELYLVRELIQESLEKAAKSMEQMLKIRINPELQSFGSGFLNHLNELDYLGRFKVHVVKVKFEGEINGAFYFIINDHEVDLINKVCLPESFNSDKRTESKMMKHGFMAEIENLIAALSLREISEFLGVQIMGGVPDVQILKGDEVNEFLHKQNLEYNTAFYVHSVLSGKVVNIAPLFIWMLDDKFIEQLRLNIVS
ncbi:MAG: chemotaxis protein CheY-P-specific phosphatase CheC [Cyclobacteriaceae bacterium]|jgi:chemotaxis protein CheY-P-specific phosphatase CheC